MRGANSFATLAVIVASWPPGVWGLGVWGKTMRDERSRTRRSETSLSAVSPDELMRYTEEHLALARQLVQLAHDLCMTASELRELAQMQYECPPTRQ
jgi:hypothetical protein